MILLRLSALALLLMALPFSDARAQTNERNYVLSRTYKQRNVPETNGNQYAGTPQQVITQLGYIDGLGRPTQQIEVFAGPGGEDLLTQTEYDPLGRPTKAFLPRPAPSNNGQFVNNPDGSFYNNAALVCSPTSNPFTETRFEAAALNRQLETKAPGLGTGVRTEYRVNSDLTVKRYKVDGGGLTQITQEGDYPASSLTYTLTRDENDNTQLMVQNPQGQPLLRQVRKEGEFLDTYYVYDELGQLRAILQPQYQVEANLDKYAFLYEYDNRGRLIRKRLPGQGLITLSYDERDRLTGMTDANGRVFYYRYDEANRQTEMGVDGNPLLYSYYDHYNFGPFRGFVNELGLSGEEHFVNNPQGDARRGLPTGQLARVLNPDGGYGDWLQTVSYYDNKNRLIQTQTQLYGLGGGAYQQVSFKLGFDGLPQLARTTQSSSSKLYVLEKTFEYDQASRLTKASHRFWENNVLRKDYVHLQQSYNLVGQLAGKRLHGGMQGHSLKYQPRGWLCEQGSTAGPQLTLNLAYQANGNVSSVNYSTPNRSGGQSFSYDGASRLTNAWGSGSFQDYHETGLSYDRNGNLTGLSRSRPGLTIDQLSYQYAGNRLHRINDNSGQGEGFVNGADQDNELSYDGMGNLMGDLNRGIGVGQVQYNPLNLVRYANQGGQELRYYYDGSGSKLQLAAPGGNTFYAGGFEYQGDGTLLRLGLEEGQLVRSSGGDYQVQYYLKDQLGNVRLVVDEGGSVVQETEYYAFGYAVSRTGADKNKYGYSGKELQPTTGWLDFGARQYDPLLGRWHSIDPHATRREWLTPYNFCQNNPSNRIDPDGAFDFVINGQGNIYWDKNANSQATTKAGETYLGTNLTFTFNSYINNTYDGPQAPWDVTGDKLTSTIHVKGNEDKNGNLTSIDVKSSYSVGKTGGYDIFEGNNYFPGLGTDQNKAIDAKGITRGSVTFEQHASVPGLEALGLNMLGYDVVNVAQKMTLGLSGNNLSVKAGTDVFPSATLSVNGNQLFQYNQPSFTGTHGRDIRTILGDSGTGGSTITETISRRSAPSFYQRYPK